MDNINQISSLLEKVRKEPADVESRKRLREIVRNTPQYIIKSVVPQKAADKASFSELRKQNRPLEEILSIGEERLLTDPWNMDTLLNLGEAAAEVAESPEHFNVIFYMFKDITEKAIPHHGEAKEDRKKKWFFIAHRMLLIAYSKKGDFENASKIREISEGYLLNKDPSTIKELDDLVANAYSNKLKKEGHKISEEKRVKTDLEEQKREKEIMPAEKKSPLEDALKLYESAQDVRDYLQVVKVLQKTVQEHGRETKAMSLLYLGLCYEALSRSSLCPEDMDHLVSECYKKALDSGIEGNELWKDILYTRANVYEKQGNAKKAIEDFLKIFSVDVNYKDVAEKIIPGIKFKNSAEH